jgi:hypothetical protein
MASYRMRHDSQQVTGAHIARFPHRIGIVLSGLEETNLDALRYLILELNRLQGSFEFEFYSLPPDDPFLRHLGTQEVDRERTKDLIPPFAERCRAHLEMENETFGLQEPPPPYFIVVCLARFSDSFYSARKGIVSVLALGNWERHMAPPSIFEFLLTLITREAVAAVSPSLRGSIHLGTKGCLFDFTPHLGDAKFKVLSAFICAHCRAALETNHLSQLKEEILTLLEKKWLGRVD